jgi:hypothetical protein
MRQIIILVVIAFAALALASCSKQSLLETPAATSEKNIQFSFDVVEQQNVLRYEIEVSENGGKDFIKIGSLPTDHKSETSYMFTADVSKFKLPLLARLISVDVDARATTFETISVR